MPDKISTRQNTQKNEDCNSSHVIASSEHLDSPTLQARLDNYSTRKYDVKAPGRRSPTRRPLQASPDNNQSTVRNTRDDPVVPGHYPSDDDLPSNKTSIWNPSHPRDSLGIQEDYEFLLSQAIGNSKATFREEELARVERRRREQEESCERKEAYEALEKAQRRVVEINRRKAREADHHSLRWIDGALSDALGGRYMLTSDNVAILLEDTVGDGHIESTIRDFGGPSLKPSQKTSMPTSLDKNVKYATRHGLDDNRRPIEETDPRAQAIHYVGEHANPQKVSDDHKHPATQSIPTKGRSKSSKGDPVASSSQKPSGCGTGRENGNPSSRHQESRKPDRGKEHSVGKTQTRTQSSRKLQSASATSAGTSHPFQSSGQCSVDETPSKSLKKAPTITPIGTANDSSSRQNRKSVESRSPLSKGPGEAPVGRKPHTGSLRAAASAASKHQADLKYWERFPFEHYGLSRPTVASAVSPWDDGVYGRRARRERDMRRGM